MTSRPAAQELQALLDVAIDAIIVIDDRGVIEIFNHAAEKLFGYRAAEVIGTNVSRLMPEPDRGRHDSYLRQHLTTGIAHVIGGGREVDACRKDGSLFPAWLSIGCIQDSEPARFVGFLHDITARRRAQEDERRALQRLAEVSHLAVMADMAADIAHEINQPLAAITNYAMACERLLTLPEPDVAEVREALKEIAAQALRAGESIRRLREVVRNRKQASIDSQAQSEKPQQ